MTDQNYYNPEIQGEQAPDAQFGEKLAYGSGGDLNEIGQRYDALIHLTLGQQESEQVRHIAQRDLNIQTGPDNQVLDSEGRRISKLDDQQREGFAEKVVSLEKQQGDELRVRRIARSMRAVTEEILKKQGIEPLTNVGQGMEAPEVVLIADNVSHMLNSGGASELDPTSTKQVERITNQDIGLEAIKVIDKDPSKLSDIFDDNKDKALAAAEAVSLFRQNGTVNHRTTEALGRKMRGSIEGASDFPKAA